MSSVPEPPGNQTVSVEKIGGGAEFDERKFEGVERARRNVEKAVLLDAYLEREKYPTYFGFLDEFQICESSMPEALRERFRTIIDEWTRDSGFVRKALWSLGFEAKQEIGNNSEAAIAKTFYEGVLRGQGRLELDGYASPIGSIQVVGKGPFFTVYFFDKQDYAELYRADSGGSFHRSELTKLVYQDRNLIPPMLFVNGPPSSPNAILIVRHERQHFINHQWMKKEVRADGDTGLAAANDAVKDEIIAYLRDGHEPLEIKSVLNNDAYLPLFTGMTDEAGRSLKRSIEEVCLAANDATLYFPTMASRTLLVFHLIDTPLEQMADRVRTLIAFEKTNGNPAAKFEIPGRETEFLIPPDEDAV